MRALLFAVFIALLMSPSAGATEYGLDCMFGTEEEWQAKGIRLGDTLEEFRAVFGEPNQDVVGPEWNIDECGTIILSHTDDGYVISISVFPPEGDAFTVGQAQLIAMLFIPEDADSVSDEFVDGYGFVYVLHSNTLLNNLPSHAWDYADNSPQYGNFTTAYWVDSKNRESGKFNAVFIDLEVEE